MDFLYCNKEMSFLPCMKLRSMMKSNLDDKAKKIDSLS